MTSLLFYSGNIKSGVKIFNVTGSAGTISISSVISWTRITVHSAIGTNTTKTVSIPSSARAIRFIRFGQPAASSIMGHSIVWFDLFEMPYISGQYGIEGEAFRPVRYNTNLDMGYNSYWKYNKTTVTVISSSSDSPTFAVYYI